MILPPGFPRNILAASDPLSSDALRPGDAAFWQGAGDWASAADAGSEPGSGAHGRLLSGLGRLYLDHGDPARALVLGLAALAMGDAAPPTVLLVAAAFLAAGDADQAEAALSRLDAPGRHGSRPADAAEIAARDWLTARILFARNRREEARAVLERLLAALPSDEPAAAAAFPDGAGDDR